MKSRTKQSLMKRVNSQSSFTTTCKPSDTGTFYQVLHRTNGQHLSIVLFLLLSMGVGLGTATAQAQTRAYVTNDSGSNSVSVIDTATNTVVATIAVGLNPVGVAITPDGARAYVPNAVDNTVSGIDTATNTVVATISVGQLPLGVAITPAPPAPKSKEECKHGGYLKFGPPAGPFKNQGQCVSYVEHHSH